MVKISGFVESETVLQIPTASWIPDLHGNTVRESGDLVSRIAPDCDDSVRVIEPGSRQSMVGISDFVENETVLQIPTVS